MDSVDVVDDVNALLKLGVGDAYRLEHIKQAYVQNKTIWVTDENYLKRMREKYLTRTTSDITPNADVIFENEPENNETIHCWKCGKKGPLNANFCMTCGSSLFEVGTTPQSIAEPKPSNSKNIAKTIPLKIPIIVGIPALILIILGAGYSQGYFDSVLESSSSIPDTVIENEVIFYGEYDSKCGDGTVLDPETNFCVPGMVLKTIDSDESNSKCGDGTVFDSDTNTCIPQ